MSARSSRRILRTTVADGLRARVRRALDLCAFTCASAGVLIEIVEIIHYPTLRTLLATIVMAAIATVGFLGLIGRVTWSPIAFVVLVLVANVTYLLMFGPWFGLGAVYILALAIALLFGSPRHARLVAIVLVATPTLVGIAVHANVVATVYMDLHDLWSWGRATLATVTALFGISLVSHFTVRQLVVERRAIENMLARERSERLERDRVADDLARARRADAIAQLAAEVGADIGAALAIIHARANLLAAELTTTDARDSLVDILEAAGNAGSTMRQLTAFSPHTPTDGARGDGGVAIHALHKLVRRVLPPSISLTITTLDEVTVPIDTSDLTRICANLVLNARDAIETTGAISVSLTRNATHATIAVRDNGTGMDAQTLANLFQPFFTTKALGRGTGLGLATTRILVERAGGTISVDSTVGIGTTFTIRLPLLAAVAV